MLTATDLFAGAGGMSEGLRQAGWQIRCAADNFTAALRSHAMNHPDAEHRPDNLHDVDWRDYPSTELLAAAPSCVWHARARGRKALPESEERRRVDAGAIDRATAFAVIAAADVHRYPAIVVENVPEYQKWTLYHYWLNGLRELGYTVQTLVLDAAHFGHAQNRKRWFCVATLGVSVDLTLPDRVDAYATQILDDDPGKPVTRRLYVTPQIDEIDSERVPHLVMYRKHGHARRADTHRLATVTSGGNHHAVAQLIDGVPYARMLTNVECARAQGFPDSYLFVGKRGETTHPALDPIVKRLIGNATPVNVASWIGTRLRDALLGGAA